MENLKQFDERTEYAYSDIAEKLANLTGIKNPDDYEQLESALYHLETIAENEFNLDYFRVLYNVLYKLSNLDIE